MALVLLACSEPKQKPEAAEEKSAAPAESTASAAAQHPVQVDNPDPRLRVESKGDGLIVSHAIAHRHPNPCDFSGEQPELDSLVDFHVEFEPLFEGLRASILKREAGAPVAELFLDSNAVKTEPGFLERVMVGGKKGYRISMGAEGCGIKLYYLETGPWTLRVTQKVIGEFNNASGGFAAFENLPGVISPMDTDGLLIKLLESVRISKP